MAKVDELLADYGDHHRTRGNVACHFVGIPLIVFGLLAALGAVRLGTVAGVTVTGAEVLIGVGVLYYLTLDERLALGMLAVTAGLDALGRVAGWQVGVAAFVVGWVFQGIGHAVYEKRSPAFLRNFVHLMVGPIFLLNEVVRVRRVEPAA
jgi:uncharacterized membrane protein YGL010W